MSESASKQSPAGQVRVALLGFGTVGSAVAQLLHNQQFDGVRLTHIYNRDIARKRGNDRAAGLSPDIVWTENIGEVISIF